MKNIVAMAGAICISIDVDRRPASRRQPLLASQRCRHRGARLLREGSGGVGNLVCPYHQWTYNLSGKLIHNEHMGEQFDRCNYGLKPVRIESLAGLLFICLAQTPPAGFEAMRAAMQPYIEPHRTAHCKVAYQYDLIEEGN